MAFPQFTDMLASLIRISLLAEYKKTGPLSMK